MTEVFNDKITAPLLTVARETLVRTHIRKVPLSEMRSPNRWLDVLYEVEPALTETPTSPGHPLGVTICRVTFVTELVSKGRQYYADDGTLRPGPQQVRTDITDHLTDEDHRTLENILRLRADADHPLRREVEAFVAGFRAVIDAAVEEE